MRKSLPIYTLALVAFVFSSVAKPAPADDFARGNEQFQAKQYKQAIESYRAALASGEESANLYFNLGNAYFKDADLGHAILYFLKARRLAPGDDDIRSNLAFARNLTSVQLEGVTLNPINSLLDSIVSPYRLSFMAWVTSFFFVAFVSLLIFRFGLGWFFSWLKSATIAVLAILVVLSFLTTFKYREDYLTRRAVIVATESEVHTGPTDQSDVELRGEPGLIVKILGESGDYYNVLFENQRRGWIRKNLVAEV